MTFAFALSAAPMYKPTNSNFPGKNRAYQHKSTYRLFLINDEDHVTLCFEDVLLIFALIN